MEKPELTKLYMAIQNLREAMEGGLTLNDFDRISLENYIAVLQITYLEWQRKNADKFSRKAA